MSLVVARLRHADCVEHPNKKTARLTDSPFVDSWVDALDFALRPSDAATLGLVSA